MVALFVLILDLAAASGIAPSSLPVCANQKDPLSALCKLGAPAADARFECKKPEPIMFCGPRDDWCCRYMAFAGETPPPVTYHARFDHEGPPVKSGDIVDTRKFKRRGIVRGVAVHLVEKDEAEGKRRMKEIGDKLAAWGCNQDDKGWRRLFQCGSWEASVTYNNIIHQVIVEAAEKGTLECR